MRLSASIGLAAAIACCSAAPTSTEQSWIGEFYSLTVAYRRSQGCASDIVVFGGVVAAAQTLSEDMVAQGFFSHIEPNGAGPGERLAAAGVTEMSGWAENIYQGYQTAQGGVSRAQEALDAWIASPGHHANLVNCAYTHHGVGVKTALNGAPYWTHDFVTFSSTPPTPTSASGGAVAPSASPSPAASAPAQPSVTSTGSRSLAGSQTASRSASVSRSPAASNSPAAAAAAPASPTAMSTVSPAATASPASTTSATATTAGSVTCAGTKGMWVWTTTDVIGRTPAAQDAMVSTVTAAGVTDLYLYMAPGDYSALEAQLRPFIARLSSVRISAWALDGSRSYFSDADGPTALYIGVQGMIDYNARVQPAERFVGFHADMEPQDGQGEPRSSFHNGLTDAQLSTTSGGVWQASQAQDRQALMQNWLDITSMLRSKVRTAGLRLGASMPSWTDNYYGAEVAVMWGASGARQGVMKHMMGLLDDYVVMSYNTNPATAASRVIGEAQYASSLPASSRPRVYAALETVTGVGSTISYGDTAGKQSKAAVLTDIGAIMSSLSTHPAVCGVGIHAWHGWESLPDGAVTAASPASSPAPQLPAASAATTELSTSAATATITANATSTASSSASSSAQVSRSASISATSSSAASPSATGSVAQSPSPSSSEVVITEAASPTGTAAAVSARPVFESSPAPTTGTAGAGPDTGIGGDGGVSGGTSPSATAFYSPGPSGGSSTGAGVSSPSPTAFYDGTDDQGYGRGGWRGGSKRCPPGVLRSHPEWCPQS